MQWGCEYTTCLDVEAVASIVTQQGMQHGYRLISHSASSHRTEISLKHTSPWYALVLRTTPQRVVWSISDEGELTHITCDIRYFKWYAALILCCCALMPFLFIPSWSHLTADWLENEFDLRYVITLLSWFLMVFFVFYLINAGGCDRVLRPVQTQVELRGFQCEPDSYRESKRYVAACVTYVVFVLSFLVWPFLEIDQLSLSSSDVFILGLLLIMLTVLIVLLGVMIGKPRTSLRVVSILCGYSVAMAFLFATAPIMVWAIPGEAFSVQELIELRRMAEQFLDGDHSMLRRAPSSESELQEWRFAARQFPAFFDGFSLVAVGVSMLFGVIALAFLRLALRLPLRSWYYLIRLQTHAHLASRRDAVTAQGRVRAFSCLIGLAWLSIALISWSLFIGLLITSGRALLGGLLGWEQVPVGGTIEVAVYFCHLAFHEERQDLIAVAVYWAFVVWAGGLLCGLAMSLGSLIVARTRTRRWLLAKDVSGRPQYRCLVAEYKRVAKQQNLSGTELIVLEEGELRAESYHFGFVRPSRLIVLSSRCMEILTPAELVAIACHELAHHKANHCRWDVVLRYLGRITFVGDTFMRSLEDSFGYECRADQIAVSELGANADALCTALVKMHHVSAAEGKWVMPWASSLSAVNVRSAQLHRVLEHGLSIIPAGQRFLLSLRWAVDEYTGRVNLSYWHPSIHERRARLAPLTAERGIE